MEKENLQYSPSSTMQEERKKLIHDLLKNEDIIEFLSTFNLSEDVVSENAYQLKAFVDTKSICEGCQGLFMCKQENTGFVLSPTYIDDLDVTFKPCKYKQETTSALKHSNHIILNDLSEQQLRTSLNSIDIDETNRSQTMLLASAMKILNHDSTHGLYVYGEPGVGKTYTLSVLANELAKQDNKVAFVNVPKLIADLKMIMQDNLAFKKRINILRTVPYLFLDDIGGESASSWSRDDILLPILNERMEHKLLTCFSSNYSQEDLQRFYSLKSKSVNDVVGAKRLSERVNALSAEKLLKGINRRI